MLGELSCITNTNSMEFVSFVVTIQYVMQGCTQIRESLQKYPHKRSYSQSLI